MIPPPRHLHFSINDYTKGPVINYGEGLGLQNGSAGGGGGQMKFYPYEKEGGGGGGQKKKPEIGVLVHKSFEVLASLKGQKVCTL